MKIIIGASKAAEDFIKNREKQSMIVCYDNDRRKWGKKFADEYTIINFKTLEKIIKKEKNDVIIASENRTALYFARDLCKNTENDLLILDKGETIPINIEQIQEYTVDLKKIEERKMERYFEFRDYYKDNGNRKAYEHACNYIKIKQNNLAMPEIKGLELTNYCNLSCPNCPTPTCKRAKGYMGENVFNECFQYIPPCLTEPFSLHGLGEPLLHPNFWNILGRVVEIGVPVLISTNGLLLTDELMDNMLKTMNKVKGSVIYISFHSFKSVQNWAKCVQLIEKNNITVKLFGQVLDHNAKEAYCWLEKIGIKDPSKNNYIRFITSHSFAGNVSTRRTVYSDVEVNNRFRNCYYNLNNIVNIAWDGRIKRCCLDAEVSGNIGNIFEIENVKRKNEIYDLCHTCDPDWTSNFQ